MKAAGTFHAAIVDEVRRNILSGRWLPGHRLPVELDMAQAFGVSRMTVNKALTQLSREGFLERRRKGGTFVATPRGQSAVMEIADIRAEVARAGRVHSYAILKRSVRVATAQDAANLQRTDADTHVLALQTLHSADGAPYCLESRIIDLGTVPDAEYEAFEAEPAGPWLLRQVPWSSAELTIRALAASATDAKLLKLQAGAPCLEVGRFTRNNGKPVTFARLCYPAELHQVVAQFQHR